MTAGMLQSNFKDSPRYIGKKEKKDDYTEHLRKSWG
jgi:hypothetical protein